MSWFKNCCPQLVAGRQSALASRLSVWVAGALLGCGAVFAATKSPPALSPQDSLGRMHILAGYGIELVAAEPLVESPCALAWNERGQMFVAENRGYPIGAADGTQQGRIALLEDADGDGTMDKRTEFASGLMFPNGLLPWRGGLLVTDAPNLIWLSDTNGDGHADVQEVWFTGFATNQTTQLRACYPSLGPDGWVYVSRGWSGGVVTSPKWSHLPPVDLKDGDFRFRPDGSASEAIGGNAQFGLVLDDVGRRFLVSNRNPLMHAVVPAAWWRRMLYLPFTDVIQDVSPTGYDAKVYPISPDYTTSGFTQEFISATHAGTFTSACGIHRYFGEGLGPEMQGSWFICEPAQNLVQRQVAEPEGPSFRSHSFPGDRDFLACSDPWFHPVSAWTGPDGALYLADMYRKFIDHPEYLPADVRPQLDFSAGKNLGRLWRIRSLAAAPRQTTQASALLALTSGETQLVDALGAANIWTRQTAHRLLLERSPTNVIRLLADKLQADLELKPAPAAETETAELLAGWAQRRKATEPVTGPHLGQARRVQLLFDRLEVLRAAEQGLAGATSLPSPTRSSGTLSNRMGEGRVPDRFLRIWRAASLAESPSVREAAWRALQPLSSAQQPIPEPTEALVKMWVADPNSAVRFQLAYCLGQGNAPGMTKALVDIVRREPTNRWTRAVVLSGLKERQAQFVDAFFASSSAETNGAMAAAAGLDDSAGMLAFADELGRLYGAGGKADLLWEQALRETAAKSVWPVALLRGLSQGLRQRGAAGSPPLIALEERFTRDTPPMASRLVRVLDRTAALAGDSHGDLSQRTAAIGLLGELNYERAGGSLLPLLRPTEPKEIQTAAARALGQFDSGEAARQLLLPERWGGYSPALRELVLNAVLSRPRYIPALLDVVERGSIPEWAIPLQRRKQLIRHSDPGIRARAEKLFADRDSGGRRQVYEENKPVLALAGDPRTGHEVFQRVCALCHQYAGEGAKVGPDLTGVKNQRPEALLLHILVPDAEIYAGYESYECETRDGRSFSGLLVAETASTVTLRRALGEQDTVARDQIVSLAASRSSLMPSELEKVMSRQELADLLAFLREGQP